jgi:hypothetical protein
MRRLETVLFYSVVTLGLSSVSISVHSQAATEDLTPCGAAHPEPAQSGTWAVPFCNRTGHDVVVQFHDNDCPADNWSRRGNVYEKQLARGESVMVPLCYAREAQPAANPPPGVPQLRLPGGKGVITTWRIVGDCGDRSDRPRVDGRTFYDRGNYDSGIILLQYPAGASHCFGAPAVAAQSPAGAQSPAPATQAPAGAAAQSPAGAQSPAPATQAPAGAAARAPTAAAAQAPTGTAAQAPAAAATSARSNLPAGGPPALSATVDPTNAFSRIVHVFATSAPEAPSYHCKFRLNLDFSDGSSWVDRQQVDVHTGDENAPVMTRKYGKTVTRVVVTSPACAPSG